MCIEREYGMMDMMINMAAPKIVFYIVERNIWEDRIDNEDYL